MSSAIRRARESATSLLVDLVHLVGGSVRLSPDEVHAYPEAAALLGTICEAFVALQRRTAELAAAIVPLRASLNQAAARSPTFVVQLADLAAPTYLELLIEAARRHAALLLQCAAQAGVASDVAGRSITLQQPFEPPPAPVSYLMLGACVEQEFRAIEQSQGNGANSSAAVLSEASAAPSFSQSGPAGPAEDARGLLSCADLAAAYGVDQERLRGRLKRWQKTCFTGWVEVTDRGPRDPQYLYQVSAVLPILRALQGHPKENE